MALAEDLIKALSRTQNIPTLSSPWRTSPKKPITRFSLVPAHPDYPAASAAYFLSAALSRRASCSSCFQRQAVYNAAMDDGDIIERTPVEMIKRFRSGAAHIARELAEIADENQHDPSSAETWRNVADMVERLWPKP